MPKALSGYVLRTSKQILAWKMLSLIEAKLLAFVCKLPPFQYKNTFGTLCLGTPAPADLY
jgi:hypothetical protein